MQRWVPQHPARRTHAHHLTRQHRWAPFDEADLIEEAMTASMMGADSAGGRTRMRLLARDERISGAALGERAQRFVSTPVQYGE